MHRVSKNAQKCRKLYYRYVHRYNHTRVHACSQHMPHAHAHAVMHSTYHCRRLVLFPENCLQRAIDASKRGTALRKRHKTGCLFKWICMLIIIRSRSRITHIHTHTQTHSHLDGVIPAVNHDTIGIVRALGGFRETVTSHDLFLHAAVVPALIWQLVIQYM